MGNPAMFKATLLFFFLQLVVPFDAMARDGGLPDPGAEEEPEFPPDRIPQIDLSVQPTEVTVGEVVYWRLAIARHHDVQVRLGTEASFGGLEVRSKQVSSQEVSGDLVNEVMEVQLIGFEPGEMEIPAQVVTAVDRGGQIEELTTDAVTVSIKSLIANEPEPKLREDMGPGEKVIVKDYLLLWILGVLVGIGFVVATTLLIRRLIAMRRSKSDVFVPPPRPAEEIALEKLTLLRGSALLDEGQVKLFHVRLSEAVREYLGNRYLFDSLELSTEELAVTLRATTIKSDDFDAVGEFLGVTDLVKFAKVVLSREESLDLLDQSVAFVHKTTPPPRTPLVDGGDQVGNNHV
jgi:hypothetical protein